MGRQKNKSGGTGAEVEYFLGGKSTPLIVLAMSYAASAVSAGSFIGDPGMMSTIGWPYFWLVVGVVPDWFFLDILLSERCVFRQKSMVR